MVNAIIVSYTFDIDFDKQKFLENFIEKYKGKYKDIISPPKSLEGKSITIGEPILLEIIGLFDRINIKVFKQRIDIIEELNNLNNISNEKIKRLYQILDNLITPFNVKIKRLGNVLITNKIIDLDVFYKITKFYCNSEEKNLVEFGINKVKRFDNLYNSVISINLMEILDKKENKVKENTRNFNAVIDINTAPWKIEEINPKLETHKGNLIDLLLKEVNNFKTLEVIK